MRTGSGSLHRVVALAALLGAASGCAGEDAPDPTVETEATDEGPRLTLDAVTWALAWTGVKNTGRGCSLSKVAYEHLTRPKSYHLKKAG